MSNNSINNSINNSANHSANNNSVKGDNYSFFNQSCLEMNQCHDQSIALTITSPPYWNSIDYDIHAKDTKAWHRERKYSSFGNSYEEYLDKIEKAFQEVLRTTMEGGFCAIVVGTILYKGKHYATPMAITERMVKTGWKFHQDIIWNKVTGGVRRAGSYIQNPRMGYYYPNIMTEYILLFRKEGAMRRGKKEAIAVDELFTKDIANNIWHIAPVPPRTINHPCPYPEELVRRVLLLYSQEGDTILDPFLGSGQTALVSVQNNRKCIGYDTELEYLELSKNRIENSPKQRKHNLINNLMTPTYDRLAVN